MSSLQPVLQIDFGHGFTFKVLLMQNSFYKVFSSVKQKMVVYYEKFK